jgi:hypothetical protein
MIKGESVVEQSSSVGREFVVETAWRTLQREQIVAPTRIV